MSDWITLSPRAPLVRSLWVHGVQPNRFAESSASQIAAMPVWSGREQGHLGDFFTIRGERSARVRVEGSTTQIDGLGGGMLDGELVVEGDAGTGVGAGMAGGTLHVRGSVGNDAGLRMSGGVLRVDRRAGDRLGAAIPGAAKGMTGGEIIVLGSVGAEAGAHARRGLIVVCGSVGRDAARAMIAGTLVVLGSCGDSPGRGSKRGSIVACGDVTVPGTYRYTCTFRPPHVRLMLTYLKRQYGLDIEDAVAGGLYRRYCGDAGDPGKGEILERVHGV